MRSKFFETLQVYSSFSGKIDSWKKKNPKTILGPVVECNSDNDVY